MFARVGRRLAFLNALVVIAIIATVGGVTFVALRRSLDREIDNALRERIEQFRRADISLPAPTQQPNDTDDEDDDHDEDERHADDIEILASGDTILIVVDRAGTVVYNPRDITLAGVPVAAGIERALRGERDTRSVAIGDDGSMRVMTTPLTSNGEVVGAVQALRSLREHDAELALVQWMTLLGMALGVVIAIPAGLYLASRAMRPINAAFDRQRAFVADASHELRTPLTLMRANADYALMDDSKRIADVRKELENIVAEVDRTDRLVDDLLTLARADAQQLHLVLRDVAVLPLVSAATEALRPLYIAKGVQLTAATEPACAVHADGERVEQVLRNLLENALRHTPAGGRVEVGVRCAERLVEIEVRDTGSGIAPEHLPRVFERFYRADHARSRADGGVGLGLAIAQALINAQRGSIRVHSRLGQGTSVIISLPAAPARSGPV